jgi:hypothetical protein
VVWLVTGDLLETLDFNVQGSFPSGDFSARKTSLGGNLVLLLQNVGFQHTHTKYIF